MHTSFDVKQIVTYIEATESLGFTKSHELKNTLSSLSSYMETVMNVHRKMASLLEAMAFSTFDGLQEKLSLSETAQLAAVSRLDKYLLKESIFHERINPTFARVFKRLKKTTESVKHVEELLRTALQLKIKSTLQSGDLVFQNKKRFARYRKEPPFNFLNFSKKVLSGNLFAAVQPFLPGSLSHVGFINTLQDEKDNEPLRVAEILTAYQNERPFLDSFLYNDFYRLDLEKLLTKEGTRIVSRLCSLKLRPVSPEEYIRQRFSKIVNETLRANAAFLKHVQNSQGRSLRAYLPLFCCGRSHQKDFKKPFRSTMHSSEFAFRLMIECIKKLEARLREENAKEFSYEGSKKIKPALFNGPFPDLIKPQRMHPQRLFSYLSPLLKKIDTSHIVNELFENVVSD